MQRQDDDDDDVNMVAMILLVAFRMLSDLIPLIVDSNEISFLSETFVCHNFLSTKCKHPSIMLP